MSTLHTSAVLHYPIQGIEQLTLTVTATNLERKEGERERILVYHMYIAASIIFTLQVSVEKGAMSRSVGKEMCLLFFCSLLPC